MRPQRSTTYMMARISLALPISVQASSVLRATTPKRSSLLGPSTPVVRDEDRLPQQMVLRGRYHHRDTGVGGHVQFLDAQRIDGEGIAMWRLALVRTRSVISVVAEIGAALHRPRRQNGAMLGASALGKSVSACGQVINDPVPPSGGIAVLVRIE